MFALSIVCLTPDLFARGSGYRSYRTPSYKSYGGGSTGVSGYTKRSTGTYVMPHQRTAPDSNRYNNWSTQGNVNPYTGKKGSKSY